MDPRLKMPMPSSRIVWSQVMYMHVETLLKPIISSETYHLSILAQNVWVSAAGGRVAADRLKRARHSTDSASLLLTATLPIFELDKDWNHVQ